MYLISIELVNEFQYYPRHCEVIRSFSDGANELLLVNLNPPIKAGVYEKNNPTKSLLLHARDREPLSTLLKVQKWPIVVNVCTLTESGLHRVEQLGGASNLLDIEQLSKSDYIYYDIGQLYETKDKALKDTGGTIARFSSVALPIVMDGSGCHISSDIEGLDFTSLEISDSDTVSPVSIDERKMAILSKIISDFDKFYLKCNSKTAVDCEIISETNYGSYEINENCNIKELYESLIGIEWDIFVVMTKFSDFGTLSNAINESVNLNNLMSHFPIVLWLSSKKSHQGWVLTVNNENARNEVQIRNKPRGCLF